ncbi:MAG: hypothetical protein J6K63_03685 [Clostridia bacterium]|nr:hypothetical protein [Clostridia bacterium]
MKLLIAGSRSIENFADQHKISKLIIYPGYDIYGKAAPLKRNETMVDLADQILIIWDGISHGTKHTVSYAQKKNKNIVLLII